MPVSEDWQKYAPGIPTQQSIHHSKPAPTAEAKKRGRPAGTGKRQVAAKAAATPATDNTPPVKVDSDSEGTVGTEEAWRNFREGKKELPSSMTGGSLPVPVFRIKLMTIA